jgi:hypothetical protein
MTSRPSTAAPILVVLAVVLLLIGGYVGAYLGMAKREYHYGPGSVRMDRTYAFESSHRHEVASFFQW